MANFYPRSPCGERPKSTQNNRQRCIISIHALLAESDAASARGIVCRRYFYPRSPCGERRFFAANAERIAIISIHALLAESDGHEKELTTHFGISIHALLAESDRKVHHRKTLHNRISIHALLAESDGSGTQHLRRSIYFYPRSPCGERRRKP